MVEHARGTSDSHVVKVPLDLLEFVAAVVPEAFSLRDL